MNELEQKIFQAAKNKLPEIKERLKQNQSKCRFVEFAFHINCIMHTITYDRHLMKFTKITYPKGIGNGIYLEGIKGFAFFDKYENCDIDISSFDLS